MPAGASASNTASETWEQDFLASPAWELAREELSRLLQRTQTKSTEPPAFEYASYQRRYSSDGDPIDRCYFKVTSKKGSVLVSVDVLHPGMFYGKEESWRVRSSSFRSSWRLPIPPALAARSLAI